MNEQRLIGQFRVFLRGLALALFGGTIGELALLEHTEDPAQWLPFALCALGIVAVLLAWRRPGRGTTWLLRGLLLVVLAGSAFGAFEHIAGNRAFYLETRPQASTAAVLRAALTGVAPVLAPGILVAGAAVALASTLGAATAAPARPTTAREKGDHAVLRR